MELFSNFVNKLTLLNNLKRVGKRIPGARALFRRYTKDKLFYSYTEEIFNYIFHWNMWGNQHSVSGSGSDLLQTRIIVQEIPRLLKACLKGG